MEIAMARDAMLISVWDPGPGFVPRPPPEPLRGSAGGGGLYLVQLASGWGVEDDGPTRVWAEPPVSAVEERVSQCRLTGEPRSQTFRRGQEPAIAQTPRWMSSYKST